MVCLFEVCVCGVFVFCMCVFGMRMCDSLLSVFFKIIFVERILQINIRVFQTINIRV